MKRKTMGVIIRICVMLLAFALLNMNAVFAQVDPTKVKELETKLNRAIQQKKWNYAAIYAKELAVLYDKAREYEKAAALYDRNAEYWAKAGHADWGIVNSIRADHIRTEVELYIGDSISPKENLAKHEPVAGTYLGMYVAEKRAKGEVRAIKEIYGKKHALFLTYVHWKEQYPSTQSYFPLAFAEKVKAEGGALQIAWEPSFGLDEVVDDEYVRTFAREAKSTGVPIFLRFAGEMNGEWVPWYDKPEKYVEKFRLIHDIMEEEAPNVAMVWSPNFLPRHNIAPYYPGDKYVDWVGFSLYTIPFSHGEEVPGGNPIDYLRPLYKAYSHKPIMISEGAVSHFSYETGKDYTKWALGQLGNMYAFLPRIYPQVKAITYFNLDKKTTNYDNKNNNYDLGDNPQMDMRYQEIIADGHFLSDVETGIMPEDQRIYKPIVSFDRLNDERKAFVYIKLPLGNQPSKVRLYQGSLLVAESDKLPWDMEIDFSRLDDAVPLTVVALNEAGEKLVQKSFEWKSTLFADIKHHWAKKDIVTAVEKGWMKGYQDGNFLPDQPMTRAEFFVVLSRLFQWGNGYLYENLYDDIKGHWAEKTIQQAANFGVMEPSRTFRPDDALTRAEMAQFLSLALRLAPGTTTFVDLEDHWSSGYVGVLESLGIINGMVDEQTSKRLFYPDQPVKRAEIAKLLINVDQFLRESQKAE